MKASEACCCVVVAAAPSETTTDDRTEEDACEELEWNDEWVQLPQEDAMLFPPSGFEQQRRHEEEPRTTCFAGEWQPPHEKALCSRVWSGYQRPRGEEVWTTGFATEPCKEACTATPQTDSWWSPPSLDAVFVVQHRRPPPAATTTSAGRRRFPGCVASPCAPRLERRRPHEALWMPWSRGSFELVVLMRVRDDAQIEGVTAPSCERCRCPSSRIEVASKAAPAKGSCSCGGCSGGSPRERSPWTTLPNVVATKVAAAAAGIVERSSVLRPLGVLAEEFSKRRRRCVGGLEAVARRGDGELERTSSALRPLKVLVKEYEKRKEARRRQSAAVK